MTCITGHRQKVIFWLSSRFSTRSLNFHHRPNQERRPLLCVSASCHDIWQKY